MNEYNCRKRPPKEPPHCGRRPPRAQPKVVGAAQDHFRCLPARLCVEGLPCGAFGPFSILSIEAAGEARILPPKCLCGRRAQGAEVEIPLTVWVCDGCGCRHCGRALLCVWAREPLCGAHAPGVTTLATAAVRLIGADCCECEPVFDVRLEVWVDIYTLRLEPCGCCAPPDCRPGRPFPPHTALPMYPQMRWQ